MTKKIESECERLLSRFFSFSDNRGGWQTRTRNELFTTIKPVVEFWVKNFFRKKKVWKEKSELTALCWFSYLYGLKAFKRRALRRRKYTILGHFYRYTTYYLSKILTKEGRVAKNEVSCPDFDGYYTSSFELSFECMEIRKFAGMLPDYYQEILRDVLCGEGISNDKRMKINNYRMGQYDGAKKILKIIVRYFLLGSNGNERGFYE